MNQYIEYVVSHLTDIQVNVVNRIDVLLPKLGDESHIDDLATKDWDNMDDIPQNVMADYDHYLYLATASHLVFEEGISIVDKVEMAETLVALLYNEHADLVLEFKDSEEDEFFHYIMGSVTDNSNIYWEDKGDLTPSTYRLILEASYEELDEEDELEIDEEILVKTKEFFAKVKNPEELVMHELVITSSTLPIDFVMSLEKLANVYDEDSDKDTLIKEIEALGLVTDADSTYPGWKENVINVFGYFPSDKPVFAGEF